MRLLLIDDDVQFRRLLRHHIMCRWPLATVVEYDPVERGTLAAEVRAQGFDAVLLDHAWAVPEAIAGRGQGGAPSATASVGLQWLEDLAQRPGFAPVVFLAERRGDAVARRAWSVGACAVFSKEKIEHEDLLAAIGAAAERQAQARLARDEAGRGPETYRFSGARIPGYRRIRRLANGPVCDLYVAESEIAPELVAIKVARDRLSEGQLDDSFRRFLQEHEIVQRIRHPAVVRLYDLGVSDEHAYLVMEYFPRGDLRRRLRRGLTPHQALVFARGIARALQAIHEAGVLHRDLKPGNVMLRGDGSLALIDFGLAKHHALQRDITDQGLIFGTPHYMSPEQGHAEPIDARSDVYSLGVVLFEMLTGRKPYLAENPMAIIYLHRNAPIPALPDSLGALQPLVARLLAKEPRARFDTAAEAAEAIERAMSAWRSSELAA